MAVTHELRLLVLFSVALVAVSIALIVVCYNGSQYSLTCDPISVLCASTDNLGAGKVRSFSNAGTIASLTSLHQICGLVDIKQHYTFPHGCSQGVNKDSAFRLCYARCESNGTTIEKMSATYVNWKKQVVGTRPHAHTPTVSHTQYTVTVDTNSSRRLGLQARPSLPG